VAKYLDVHDKLGKILTQMTQHDDKTVQQQQHLASAAQAQFGSK
jgi:hypothetical protein